MQLRRYAAIPATSAPLSDGDEQGVEDGKSRRRGVLVPLERDGARARDGLLGVVRVHAQRARLGGEAVARLLRVCVARAADDHLRSVRADRVDLHARGDLRHEHARADAETRGREGDGDAVVPARGRGDAGVRRRAHEQVVERAARLERPGVLRELELQRHVDAVDEAVGAEQRRPSDVRRDARVRGAHVVGGDARADPRLVVVIHARDATCACRARHPRADALESRASLEVVGPEIGVLRAGGDLRDRL